MKHTALTDRHAALLEALERYRLLTIPLAVRLGLGDRFAVGRCFSELETRHLVHVARPPKRFGGRYVYSLAPQGAAVLEAWAAEAGQPRKVPMRRAPVRIGPHLDQRLATVSALLSLEEWADRAGATVGWMRAEHAPHPEGHLEPATAVSFEGITYIADALAEVRTSDGIPWLFALELETGGISGRIDNFRSHLPHRVEVFANDVLDNGIGWPEDNRAARCLFIFDTPELMAAAQKLVAGGKERVWRKMLFNTLANIERDFSARWWFADGTTGSLFR